MGAKREVCIRLEPAVTAKPRTCAARGRGVGPWGPRGATGGGSGRSPEERGPSRARARLAGAEWGRGVPAERPARVRGVAPTK